LNNPERQVNLSSLPDPASSGIDLPRLLQAAATGDEDAWRSVVQLYARRVYALARSRLCSHGVGGRGAEHTRRPQQRSFSPDGLFVQGHDIAEEVTQSVFVTVASKLSSGEYTEQGRFESWLFRVAMNRIRDEVRRSRRQAAPTDPDALDGRAGAPGDAEAPTHAGDEIASLRRAMAELSEQDREIVELRHHAGLSFKQMADLLAEPLGTLLARHHRALRKLKELMTGGSNPSQPAQSTGDSP
jgi:RNA polymerase sigma-70 factor (ECF subfamily)